MIHNFSYVSLQFKSLFYLDERIFSQAKKKSIILSDSIRKYLYFFDVLSRSSFVMAVLYLMITTSLLMFWPGVDSGSCRESSLCCTGHNQTCHSNGPPTDHCYCDEVCLELGDCCADFLITCFKRGNFS